MVLEVNYEGEKIGWGDELERWVLEDSFRMSMVVMNEDGTIKVVIPYPDQLLRARWGDVLWGEEDYSGVVIPGVIVHHKK